MAKTPVAETPVTSPVNPLPAVESKAKVVTAKPTKSIAALLANAKKVLATKSATAAAEKAEEPPAASPHQESASSAVAGGRSITDLLSNAKRTNQMPVDPEPAQPQAATRSITDILSSAKKAVPPAAEEKPASRSIADILSGAKKAAPPAAVDEKPAESSIASILGNAKRLPVHSVASSAADGALSEAAKSERPAASSIASLLSNAKKVSSAEDPAIGASEPVAHVSALEGLMKGFADKPAEVQAAVQPAGTAAPAKKKVSGLVPTKVLLSKTAAKN